MPDDILDIAKWKNKYPFLKKVTDIYDKFNNNEYAGTSIISYYGLCHSIIKQVDRNIEKHKDICMKLLRNLGHHDAKTEYFKPSHDRCHILYNWIYNTIEDSETTNKIIIKCFEDYISTMLPTVQYYNCSYDEFNHIYFEPRKITILKIFYDNISDIINKLNEEYNLTDSPSKNFVCECVKIYNEIDKDHCTEVSETDNKQVQTCQMLKDFKLSYMQYIYKKIDKNDKIPSLEDVDVNVEYINKCQKNQGISPLTSSKGDRAPQFAQSTTTVRGNSDASQTTEGINEGDRANSLSPTVSTALGTVAGASSLLALLYKFTPGRNWIRSGFKGGRGRINSNLYAEGPSELLFDGMEHNDFNSYSIGYEAI